MRKPLVGVAVLCLLFPAIAIAWSSQFMGKAIVLSIDVKAQSMTVNCRGFDTWTERVVKWNEKTKWTDGSDGQPEAKPATPALAKTLKKGSKVFIATTDDVLEEVRALAPTTEIR